MANCANCLYFGALLCIMGNAVSGQNYHLELQKVIVQVKHPTLNDYLDVTYLHVVKTSRNNRCVNANFTLKKGLNNDIECHIKIYQKIGSKYMKAPVHFQRRPCCYFYEREPKIWECMTKNMTIPNSCPIQPGNYTMFNKDPNDCEIPPFLPPNIPDEYLGEMIGYAGNKEIVCIKMYIKLHKRAFLGQKIF